MGIHGPTLNLEAAKVRSLGLRLGNALGEAVSILEVQQVGTGANSGKHFVALRNAGAPIGLKLSDRIPNGTQKEKLVADVAVLLGVPGACKAVEVSADEIPALAGRIATATVWLENGTRLSDIVRDQPAEVNRITTDPRSYLYQYGHWAGLGLLLGIKDNHTGN